MKVTTMQGIITVDEAGPLMIIIHHQHSALQKPLLSIKSAQYIKK